MLAIFDPDAATADTFLLVAVILGVIGAILAAVDKAYTIALLAASIAFIALGLMFFV